MRGDVWMYPSDRISLTSSSISGYPWSASSFRHHFGRYLCSSNWQTWNGTNHCKSFCLSLSHMVPLVSTALVALHLHLFPTCFNVPFHRFQVTLSIISHLPILCCYSHTLSFHLFEPQKCFFWQYLFIVLVIFRHKLLTVTPDSGPNTRESREK